jgi:heptosyltransferase II
VSQIKRVLIIRLSSLGDIVLSQRALTALPDGVSVDWLVKKGNELALFSPIIQNKILYDRPKNQNVIWYTSDLASALVRNDYDIVLDMHSVFKSWLLRFFFFLHKTFRFLTLSKRPPLAAARSKVYQWFTLSKPRVSRLLFVLLKEACPMQMRPGRYAVHAHAWVKKCTQSSDLPAAKKGRSFDLPIDSPPAANMFTLAPGSAWAAKQWPMKNFCEVAKWVYEKYGMTPLLVGLSKEKPLIQVREFLISNRIPYESAMDSPSSVALAEQIKQTAFCLSNDSFAAHFSEAFQVPVVMLFGPTHPDYGFGPILNESKAVHTGIGCSPCSKDGSLCFRLGKNRFRCQREISTDEVRSAISELLKNRSSPTASGLSVQKQ